MMMEFALEAFTSELFAELRPVIDEHYAELALAGAVNKPVLNPYFSLQDNGILRVFVARENGAAVGYAFFVVVRNPQYDNALHAKQDLVFLSSAARRGFDGINFMKWCDDQLAAEGVEVIYRHVNVDKPHDLLLLRLGYELREMVYTRRVNLCAQV